MKRFLVSDKLAVGAEITLSPEESKHATRVMRLGIGGKILLTDGKGQEAEAAILNIEKNGSLIKILSVRSAADRSFRVELLQATLKGSRMDWLVEKATELGVDAIHSMNSQFTVASDRADRWMRLAHAAMKQSGNLKMPDLHETAPFDEVLARLPVDFVGFLLSPSAKIGLSQAIARALPERQGTIYLAIGPEGGFSEIEEKILQERGFIPCLLSAQILRGETAAISALSVALHALEFGAVLGL